MKTAHITARIYWDNQDPHNQGWAWATRTPSGHDDSGPLDVVEAGEDATDEELIAALRSRLTCNINDSDIEIVR